ncbi:cell surface glycoprotein CD200 receptor 1 isoform X2 [Dermochelys coriacea]|uniref:cell surface glycoprotein CD200 receptor 1 isoform X2 n=1 Tax=Dermochelys coriacea TaxID=27794 RepID=UPI001CA8813F|nr:cell surface glycoprotein CD200 receptor 1 isoform X2 [Dermochelys coriacea]
MKAKADMNCVGKTFCAFVLLTVTEAMVPMDNIRVSNIAGSSIVLTCGNISRENLVAVIWKIRPRNGNHCTLAFRFDQKKTDRTTCNERMDWKSSPETDSALQIRQVTLTDEGCYSCETVNSDGTFNQTYTLIVLVPPEVTLTCDSKGTPVCKAAAGKPAAQISWDPNGNPKTELEKHPDGTVTVLSIYSPKETIITCFVSHLALNTSQSKECQSDMFPQYLTISAGLLGILFILALIFLCKLHRGRICYKSQIPETALTHNLQDSNEQQELEPYASYVQKENTIYNTVYEVTVREDLPPGLQSEK